MIELETVQWAGQDNVGSEGEGEVRRRRKEDRGLACTSRELELESELEQRSWSRGQATRNRRQGWRCCGSVLAVGACGAASEMRTRMRACGERSLCALHRQ
jgi:hypothetical protein